MAVSYSASRDLARFLSEDVGSGDITSLLLGKKTVTARIISREGCVVAGAAYAAEIFKMRRCKARMLARDGSRAKRGQPVISVTGRASCVLECERTALNLLARMSGIATATSTMAKKIPKSVGLYATRKTAPGLRLFDKEAVEIGGGKRHRMRLDESIMIKDNHIAADSLEGMISRAKKRHKRFEVEVESAADAVLAASMGAKVIMLDNFTPGQIRRACAMLERRGLRKKVRIEASGGITPKNVAAYGKSGADMISAGYITSSAGSIDYTLEVF